MECHEAVIFNALLRITAGLGRGGACAKAGHEGPVRLVSFLLDGHAGYGAVVGDRIACLNTRPGAAPDLRTALALGQIAGLSGLEGDDIAIDALDLLPPIPNPGKIICVATNFREPANEGKPEPEYPITFTRFAESLTGHRAPLRKPAVTAKYDFEGELAVIIGKAGFEIARDQAMAHVAGYSCFNDGSVRDWQKHTAQFTPGKNFLRSGSLGPWMVTSDEIPDVRSLRLETRVNGVVKQGIGMDSMIFDIPWLISYFSTFTPLAPGDVIATGTPSGFGSTRNPPEFLSIGDEIEVDISSIGVLRNIVAEE